MKLQRVSYAPGVGWSEWDPTLDSAQTLALLFGSPAIDAAPAIAELRRAFPRAVLLGCSTAGEIHQARVHDGTITAALVHFEHTQLRAAHAPIEEIRGSHDAGTALGRALAGDGLRAVLVLSDGIRVNGTALASGITDALGGGVLVSGGLAGDGERFRSTWVLDGDQPRAGIVAAVGLYGDRVRVGHGSKGGWDRFGPERRVTRAEGNVLYELDGKPALALYKEYLGERAAGLPATALLFPLAVQPRAGAARTVVRTVLAVDEATQSLRFAGDIPQGAQAQLMRATIDRLVTGASDAALAAATGARELDPVLAIAISCVGRRLVLKSRIEEETEAALDVMPPATRQIGFYSYGELSPAAGEHDLEVACELHNQTMTMTTIREAA